MKIQSLILLCTLVCPLAADEPPSKPAAPAFSEISKTSHKMSVNGSSIEYDAIAGTLLISDDNDKESASLYFTAYFKKGPQNDLTRRPISFCFNGGPGSSSLWLHMGFGPKTPILANATYTKPPSTYENNPYTMLEQTDLVFIDPVSTGFSTVCEGSSPKQFHGIDEDVDSFADFIRLFLTEFKRWESPKYIVGESYGTIRAVGLAEKLHGSHFIDVNGLILISMCLNFQAYDFGNGNDLPHVLVLPSYAATAWYHKRLKPELQQKTLPDLLREVEQFALNEYAAALILGSNLDENRFSAIVKKLSDYTSLDADYLRASCLRIVNAAFFKELFRKEHKVVGRFDSRYVGFERNPLEEMSHTDPSFDAIVGPFTASFHQYLAKELKVEKLSPYLVLNSDGVFPWNFSINRITAGLGYVYMSGKLASAIEKNPSLKVFIANGYYDLATPYFASDYTVSHLKLSPSLMKNVKSYYYDAGHMMYVDTRAHAKMKSDLAAFMSP